jgi:uncharacterized membrane protein YagU involved in acid resistance
MQQRWSVPQAVLVGGALAGLLDITFAITFAMYNGLTPERLLQVVASGLLGKAAYSGGSATAAFGLACHFALSLVWMTLFLLAARQIPALAARPLISAVGFGIVVFLVMRLVVLPLSAFPSQVTFKPLATALDLLSHMFLFALPVVWSTRRALLRDADG